LGLRSLLLKEFILDGGDSHFQEIAPKLMGEVEEQQVAIQKAQNFYDRILDGYGDDSIGELGGAHLAIENISMLAAKVIEDCRIGGSPLEKSTRYIFFDQKVKGEYLFLREEVLMTSAYKSLYVDTCNMLFDTYSKLIPGLTAYMEKKFPPSPETPKAAYVAAIRAKVLDCIRGLLPVSTLTNMGLFGNGRFFETLLHKLHVHPLTELQDVGKRTFQELSKVIPSFVRRADAQHRHHISWAKFQNTLQQDLQLLAATCASDIIGEVEYGAKMIQADEEGPVKVAAALLFPHCDKPFEGLLKHCQELPQEELEKILDAAASIRENRRQKSPRALEQATYTFEIVADFGVYRDLQRHRMLTQERQLLNCDLGYYEPFELTESGCVEEYRAALEKARETYTVIAKEFPEEAQYVVPMAYNIRWYFTCNLRALQWLTELRSAPQGHPGYRLIAQQMARAVSHHEPLFERFFKFVDYSQHDVGRLEQEVRSAKKKGL
jgi:thymidylate synthase ThyX